MVFASKSIYILKALHALTSLHIKLETFNYIHHTECPAFHWKTFFFLKHILHSYILQAETHTVLFCFFVGF